MEAPGSAEEVAALPAAEAPKLTEAQAARQRALARQAAKRGQQAGAARLAALPAASAESEGESGEDQEASSDDGDEQEAEQGAPRSGKRPAAKGKAGEAERERKRCVAPRGASRRRLARAWPRCHSRSLAAPLRFRAA